MKRLTFFALTAFLGSVALASDPIPGTIVDAAATATSADVVAAQATQAAQAAAPNPELAEAEDGAADADAPDEPAIQEEVQAESAELEQVREAEEKAHVADTAIPDDPAAHAASRLGLESPLRQRLRDAFGRETGPGPDSNGRVAGLPEIDHDLRRLQAEYDIPIEVNEQVIAYVRFFQSPVVRKHFVKWLGRSSKYIPVFRRILREEGLPEDTVYLAMIESGFSNFAASRAKAVGPWQFISATGRRMGLRQDFWVDERRDPERAARAAAKYLKELYGQTGDWRLAWAGYNAGVGKIYRARRAGQMDFWTMTRGRILKRETKGYVPKLMACAIVAKHPDAFGFTKEEIEAERWQEYEEVTIPHAAPLSVVADAAGVPEKAVLELNPELRRTCTPPRDYALKVPRGTADAFAKNWPALADSGKLAFAQHRAGRGESLRSVAKAYGVSQDVLARMNGLRPGRHIKAGTDLVIPLNALARSQSVAFASADRVREKPEKSTRLRRAGSRKALASADAPPRGKGRLADIAGRLRSTVQVRAGDSLWAIAQRVGVAVDELCRWNGIRNPRRFKLQAGRALVVYRQRAASAGEPGAARRG